MGLPLGKAARTLLSDRDEFTDLLFARWDRAVDARRPGPPGESAPVTLDELVEQVSGALGSDVGRHLRESRLEQIETAVRQRTEGLEAEDAFPPSFNASPHLARLAYALCRELGPESVVETGVANGATAAYILKALDANGRGRLTSIDWTPVDRNARAAVGRLVPEDLRGRWDLRHGASRRVLPAVAREVGPVGLFVSDAVHTYRAVLRELRTVQPALAPPAAVLADDIEAHAGFARWAGAARPAFQAVGRARGDNAFGVALVL